MSTPTPDLTLSMKDWERLNCQLLISYRGRPQTQAGLFTSANLVIWKILEGSATLDVWGKTYEAQAGQWFFNLPAPRYQRFSADCRIFSFRVGLRWESEAPALRGRTPLLVDDQDIPEVWPLAERLLTYGRTVGDYIYLDDVLQAGMVPLLEMRVLIMQILTRIIQLGLTRGWHLVAEHDVDPRLRLLQEELQKHPLAEPLDKTALAAKATLGPAQMNRLFSSVYGMTPRQYFDERRLDHARMTLLQGKSTIKEIAFELGFRALPHFSSWFKNNTGSSPREFREQG